MNRDKNVQKNFINVMPLRIALSSIMSSTVLALGFCSSLANAYPKIDQIVPSAGQPIKVYRDADNPNEFWYIPQSIEPWSRDGLYKSVLYQSNSTLTFIFRGQASVDLDMLHKVADANGTTIDHFAPIAYDYSKDMVCQNIYAGDPNVQWLFPTMIGNYLEVVPVSLRVKSPDLIDEVSYLIKQGGLACTVSVGFKAQNLAYRVHVTADLDQVYHRFEAAAHAEGLWWEADARALIEKLYRERVVKIESLEDSSIPQTEIDKKLLASFDEVVNKIVAALFTEALKIPNQPIADRGKPWSLRADFRQSEDHAHWGIDLQSDKIQVKNTQISLRLGLQ